MAKADSIARLFPNYVGRVSSAPGGLSVRCRTVSADPLTGTSLAGGGEWNLLLHCGNLPGHPLVVLLLRYAQSVMAQAEQTVACNRHHSLERHLCRWLLQRFDRSSDDTLAATHETVAGLLGVRHEGVTEAAGRLHKAGAIECERGRIALLDRPLLEARACECYAAPKCQTERLLPGRVPS